MPKLRLSILCAVLLLLPWTAAAEVVDSAPGGFTSRNTATVEASPGEVWAALVDDVGRWWNPAHTFSADASNLSIEARPQGCFCESLPEGGGVVHLNVVAAMPGKLLRMTGGLGPLQGQAVRGAMTWEIEAAEGDDGGTSVRLTYATHGYAPKGLESWAAPVDRVMGEALERLARYVDTGSPQPAEADGSATDAPDGQATPDDQG